MFFTYNHTKLTTRKHVSIFDYGTISGCIKPDINQIITILKYI